MHPSIRLLIWLLLLPAACTESSDPEAGATVVGTVTLPAATTGKPYSVRILTVAGSPTATPVGETTGTTAGASSFQYAISGVAAGSYFVLAFVDVDGSGGQSSTPGDQAGWYGHTGDGNPPGSPNATVPTSGTVRFDFSLVTR